MILRLFFRLNIISSGKRKHIEGRGYSNEAGTQFEEVRTNGKIYVIVSYRDKAFFS